MADREDIKVMQTCFTCGATYQFGPHRYAGRYVARYGINVCNACYESNRDGWASHYGDRIIAHLRKAGLLVPKMNADGLLPRD